jgi:methyl-accepting chemotaxis protein
MLKQMTIGARLFSLSGVLTLLTAAVAGLGFWGLSAAGRREMQSHAQARDTIQTIDAARGAQIHFKIQVQEWKNVLLRGGKPEDFEKYLAAFGKEEKLVLENLREARQLMEKQGIDAAKVEETMGTVQDLGLKYREALKQYDRARPDTHRVVDALVRGIDRAPTQGIDDIVEAIQKHASASREELVALSERENARIRTLTLLGLGVCFLVAFAFSLIAIRSVTGPVAQAVGLAERIADGDVSARVEASGADEMSRMLAGMGRMTESLRRTIGETKAGANTLASAADQIVSAARRTVQASQQQATAVQETTTSTAELAETVSVTGHRASEVQRAMDRTVQTGQGLRAELAEAQNVLGVARDEMRTIVESIQGLVGRNQQIGEIIENVRDVADQTQLLAVNAGIEAAKAGEFGRGFGVVASEMKTLADQSKKAAQRIRDIVGEVQRGTADAVRTVETGRERVQEALEPVGTMMPKVEQLAVQVDESGQSLKQILAIVQQQTVGIDQINQAMKVVQDAVRESLVQNQQLEQGAESLNVLARQLTDSVAAYRL